MNIGQEGGEGGRPALGLNNKTAMIVLSSEVEQDIISQLGFQ